MAKTGLHTSHCWASSGQRCVSPAECEALAMQYRDQRPMPKAPMTDDVSKLPAWPEKPQRGEGTVSVSFEHVAGVQAKWLEYYERESDAYRARMEALVKELGSIRMDSGYMVISGRGPKIDALLAACRRDGDQADGVRGERGEA